MSATSLDSSTSTIKTARAPGSTRALILATAAFTVSFAVWGLIAPLAPDIRDKFDLTHSQTALLLAAPVVLGSLARLAFGMATDRVGGIAFVLLLVGLAIPLILFGFSGSYPSVLALSFVIGFAGAAFAIGVPLVSSWFPPDRQGFALGIYGLGNIGIALTSLVAARLEEWVGLERVSWCFVPLVLGMALIFKLFWRDAPAADRSRLTLKEQLAIFRDQPSTWVLSLFYFVTFGGFVGISIVLPTLLVDNYDLSKTEAGTWAAAFIFTATLSRPLGGYLADRLASTAILNIVFIAIMAFAIVLAFGPSMPLLMVPVLAIGVMFGIGNGAVFKLVATMFPTQAGTVTGLVGSAGGLGGFFPPLVISAVQGLTGSAAIAFMLLSEFALACLIVNLLVVRRLALRQSET